MTKSEYLLLNALNEECYVTSNELAKRLQNSEKTIRNRINRMSDELQLNGAMIESKRGSGYKLVITDEAAFLHWKRAYLENRNEEVPEDVNDRINFILSFLLNAETYVKREYLCSFLYLTEKSIPMYIKQVEKILEKYGMYIERKPLYGMRIIGSEFQKRQCIIQHLLISDTEQFYLKNGNKSDLKEMGDMILKVQQQNHFYVTEYAFQTLIYYLFVTIHRLKHSHSISEKDKVNTDKETLHIAEEIMGLIDQKLFVNSNEKKREIEYLSIYLYGCRINKDWTKYNVVISEKLDSLCNKMLKLVYDKYAIDLRGNLELKLCLNQHLAAMDIRIQYGICISNSNIQEVKKNYYYAYTIAEDAITILEDFYHVKLSEEEIAYYALFFEMALAEQTPSKERNIVLLCATGEIGSQFLKRALEREFSDEKLNIDMFGCFDIDEIDFSKYDCVFSTVPIDQKISIPVIMIHDFLNRADIVNVSNKFRNENIAVFQKFYREQSFFDSVPGKTKEQVLNWLCSQSMEMNCDSLTLYNAVMERESLCNTDFGNLVAIPHPIKTVTDQDVVIVGILDKPILWGENRVQLVVLMAIHDTKNKLTQNFYEITSKLLLDENAVNQILKEKTFASFMTEFLKKS